MFFEVGKEVLLFFLLLGFDGFYFFFKAFLGILKFAQLGFHAAAGFTPGDLFNFQVVDNEKPGAEGAGGDVDDSHLLEAVAEPVPLFN